MKAITYTGAGGPEVITFGQVETPEPGPGQLLVKVGAAGVNRADLLQREGHYPPPRGESTIPGLEVAGTVAALGPGVCDFHVGQRVFALVAGGGYAEYCLVEDVLALPTPETWTDTFAAAVPEVFFTAAETLFHVGGLNKGEAVLIHAGGSGVGSTAIQMAHEIGAEVFTTAGSEAKLARCRELGADHGINYKQDDFETAIRALRPRGVEVVLDFVGGSYLNRNLKVLAPGGRLVLVGLLGGVRAELNLGLVIAKRLQILGSVMRSLPLGAKAAIKNRFREQWLEPLLAGRVKPVIHQVFPLARADAAQRLMAQSDHFGKLILTPSEDQV